MKTRWLPLLLAGLGTLALLRIAIPPMTVHETPPISSADCRSCHPDVWEEWQSSHHAFAFKNPEVRRLSQNFLNEECLACHAPRGVLSFAPGERVLARESDRGLAVACLACHAHPKGGVATTNLRPDPLAACAPRTEIRTAAVETCGSCHNQHGTVDQWREAPLELKQESCLSCHMASTFRLHGRKGKNHTFPAAHSLESLKSAVTLALIRETKLGQTGRVIVSLTNSGCGHHFPTDERSRAADLQWRVKTHQEWNAWQHLYRFRDPYRDEADLENTQLPAGDTWQETLEFPAEAVGFEVRLLYRTNPFQSDEEAVEVVRQELAF